MNFFKPEDFKHSSNSPLISSDAADIANAKLEREGKVVYGYQHDYDEEWVFHSNESPEEHTHKALLINIEPIAKCEHPKEKVKLEGTPPIAFYCECGVKVKPTSFAEVK